MRWPAIAGAAVVVVASAGMVYGIYLSAGGLLANQYRMQVLANNLANAETAGFKQDLTVMRERMIAARERMADSSLSDPDLSGMTGGSLVAPTFTSFAQGPVEMTGRPLDVALAGPGFFRVETPEGERYTRDGRFTINPDGELVTVAGFHPVLDERGGRIRVSPGRTGSLRIDANGELRAGDTVAGRLAVVDFTDTARLRKTGGNLLQSLGAEPRPAVARIQPGAVEKSNVDPIAAMTTMIEVSRAYQLNATLAGLADATLGRAVNDVGRVS